jgi:hypothetical protein
VLGLHKTYTLWHDTITDFSLSEGDKLDISDLIDYQASNNLADFVSVENIPLPTTQIFNKTILT